MHGRGEHHALVDAGGSATPVHFIGDVDDLLAPFGLEGEIFSVRFHVRLRDIGFRGRLFAFLLAFALVPSILLLMTWGATTNSLLPLGGATAQWDSVSASGHRAIVAARSEVRRPGTRTALDRLDAKLQQSATMSSQTVYIVRRLTFIVGGAAGLGLLLVVLLATRAA